MKDLKNLQKTQLIDEIERLQEKREEGELKSAVITLLHHRKKLTFSEKMKMVIDIYGKIEIEQGKEKIKYTRSIKNGWVTSLADTVEEALDKLLFIYEK